MNRGRSGVEIATNIYDRLLRYEAEDTSKLVGGVAESWTVSPDGKVIPLHYSYTEPDIRWSERGGIWTDAENTFDQFAYELGRGEAPNHR